MLSQVAFLMAKPQGIEPCQGVLETLSPALEHWASQMEAAPGFEPGKTWVKAMRCRPLSHTAK